MSSVSRKQLGNGLLSRALHPWHYDVSIFPTEDFHSFSGSVTIFVHVLHSTSVLEFNAHELIIKSCSLKLIDSVQNVSDVRENVRKLFVGDTHIVCDEQLDISRFIFYQSIEGDDGDLYGLVSVPLEFELCADQFLILHFEFAGKCLDATERTSGFFRYKQVGRDKSLRWMSATQFEPISARSVFPCWDEPNFKSTFTLTLIVAFEMTAISNMPMVAARVTIRDAKEYIEQTFQTTPLMSTYLLAWCIGEYDSLRVRDEKCDMDLTFYTPISKIDSISFAQNVALKAICFMNAFFEVPYPLPKLDLIAIPELNEIAMENWGLNIFKDDVLLVNADSTISSKQDVAKLVVHEFSHQWFGNLVTMDWWSQLYLNEGFATWCEYFITDSLNINPEWRMMVQFVQKCQTSAMDVDSLEASHAIEAAVLGNEIEQTFNEIAYSKGCALVRMLYSFLGGDLFRLSLSKYLKQFAYSNATASDLWHTLEVESGKPVLELMLAWTQFKGYPYLTVHRSGATIRVVQQRFLLIGSSEHLWVIPIYIRLYFFDPETSQISVETTSALIRDREIVLEISSLSNNKGVLQSVNLNADGVGFYRVFYDSELLHQLLSNINFLSREERILLQSDALAFCLSGKLSFSNLLVVLNAFRLETFSEVIDNLCAIFETIMLVANASVHADWIQSWICDFLQSLLLGLVKTSDLYMHTRGRILELLIRFRHSPTIAAMLVEYHSYHLSPIGFDADLLYAFFT